MDFSLSRQITQDLDFVAETGSTNADLVANFANAQDFSVLVAGFQTAGRGRSGRDWLAPAGSSLFVSVLLKPSAIAANRFSWIPLLAGLAMAKTVKDFLPNKKVSLKWPNDVMVESNKISGVLSELLPDLSGVVVGAGLNIQQTKTELPIETATSLAIEGNSDASLDNVLAGYLRNLKDLYQRWAAANGDAVQSGLRKQVIESCSTLGLSVKAILPGEQDLLGKAVGIDDTGRLILQPDSGAEVVAVAAGDIVHLRHN